MLAFLRSPVGKVVLGGIGALAIAGFLVAKGYSLGMERCQRDALEAALAAAERDRAIAADAAVDAAERAAALEATNNQLETIVDEQEAALAALSDADRCEWTGPEFGRLCDVLGTCGR